jgi:hypothetical protein
VIAVTRWHPLSRGLKVAVVRQSTCDSLQRKEQARVNSDNAILEVEIVKDVVVPNAIWGD